MPDPDLEVSATPEELGGFRNEEGKFEADFGSVVDDIAGKMGKDLATAQPAEDVVGDLETGASGVAGPKGETGVVSGAGEVGPSGPETGAATGPSGPVADDRDKDLHDLATQLGDLEKRPKTKQIIEGYKGKVTQERNLRSTVEKERDALRTELEEAKKLTVPKEVDEELKTLRETVRELDAARDPAIKQKFDTKISTNEDRIVTLLRENGYGMDAAGKEIAGAIEALKKGGLSRRTLHATIEKLEKSGDGGAVEAAEELKDILRENGRLSKERETEINSFKSGAEERTKTQQTETTKQVEAANQRLQKTIAEHSAKWDFLQQPPEPKPEDSSAVRAEKEKARQAHNDRVLRYNDAIKKETANPLDATITARVGIMYRDLVVPALKIQLDAKTKELETLTAQVKAMKGAGDLSRKVNSPTTVRQAPKNDDGPDHASYDDVVDAGARKMGLIK